MFYYRAPCTLGPVNGVLFTGLVSTEIMKLIFVTFQVLQNFSLSSNERILGFRRLRGLHVRVPTSSKSSSLGKYLNDSDVPDERDDFYDKDRV